MARPEDAQYPNLSDVIDEFELTLDIEPEVGDKTTSDKVYTFETHPFYSKLGDYSKVEFKES